MTTASEAAAYKVSATTTGVANATTTSANTTTDTATGVIDGLDLNFELASEARADGSIAMSEAVYISGTNDVVFTLHDTNGTDNGQADAQLSNGVTVTLTSGRAYSTASISAVINSAIAVTNDTNHPLSTGAGVEAFRNPGISASMDGYNLVLTSAATGSSGSISIASNTAATQVLGLQSGKVTGSSGENAVLNGTVDISQGISFNGTNVVRLRLHDGDFNSNLTDGTDSSEGSTTTDITFNGNTAISATSIVDTFNNYFSSNSIGIEASMTSAGKLELRSTETGSDTKVSISGSTATSQTAMVALGFINGQNDTGSGGNSAVYTGQTNESTQTVGFGLSGFFNFSVTDKAVHPRFYYVWC